MFNITNRIVQLLEKKISTRFKEINESNLLAIGSLLSKQQFSISSSNINDYEFKIFSEYGDDGIIQYLIKHIEIKNELFIEFGVENYLESNTRFLLMNNNWSGFVMDGSARAINSLKNQDWYWRYNLTQKTAFIDRDNINELLSETAYSNIGLLHIDLDGNDYHIFEAIDLNILNPSIIIVEYNSVFGNDRAVTTPYDKSFFRTAKHYSNLYFGASLPALNHLATKKGYRLVGCNLAGNNAYFVRKDLLNDRVRELSVAKAFKDSKFRESRDIDHSLSFLGGKDRLALIKGLDVFNVLDNRIEKL